ncbi:MULTISPECIES: CHAP domain-containing protein [Amycolatopsis]|uniref:Peptidase C51 domain-containing protein n=1 Tax=Amycolatopsis bullii TaxID=941987 RepID=A0ABQ3K101_9PSEU|nr:CHAP domain-containing protein [Amycolatopsis bullii]GHF94122.1 hypothetical protein GCM10017567_05740 [Amycolatopsis bullii]
MSRTVLKRMLTAVLAATAAVTIVATPASAATAQDVVGLAKANLGKHYCETNSLGTRGYESSCSGEAWCADFLKWVWRNEGLNVDGLSPAASSFYQYGRRNGTLHADAGYVPQPGDAVVFNFDGNDYADHVGMVTTVDADRRIQVINGNFGDNPTTSTVAYSSGYGQVGAIIAGQRISGFITPVGLTTPAVSSSIAVGSDGLQMVLTGNGTVLAKKGVGLYGWTVETDPGVQKVATNGGVQMILLKDGTVLAKNSVGLYGWTVETDAVVSDIAVGSDGTQMILDRSGTVSAKKGIGLYGWTAETDAVVKQIATDGGVQVILDKSGTVLAKNGIGLYGWTVESDAVVADIAVAADGTQMILDNSGTVSAKNGIGLYGWTVETDAVVSDIAVGSDGTQMILDRTGTVSAKQGVGLYGWTVETDAVVQKIATNGGVQVVLDRNGTVLAKNGIGLYGWTVESDPIA